MLRAWLDASARRRYRQFVLEGMGGTTLWAALRQQICLDDERFVERMQREAEIQGDELSIPRAQRRAPVPSLAAIARAHRDRDDAIVTAYGTGAYSYREIAEHFQLHLATVGSDYPSTDATMRELTPFSLCNCKRLIALLQVLLKFVPAQASTWFQERAPILCTCCGAVMAIVKTRIRSVLSAIMPGPIVPAGAH